MINRGTGAGGSNTNKTGLSYETLTQLINFPFQKRKYLYHNFKNSEKTYIYAHKTGLMQYMQQHDQMNKNIKPAHGCKYPDECYINLNDKIIFIVEKKFQQCSGSVCEKIQTAPFKRWHYNQLYPDYRIIYIYTLSPWFKENCKSELIYLQKHNIPIFWGYSDTYHKDLIDFILSYESKPLESLRRGSYC